MESSREEIFNKLKKLQIEGRPQPRIEPFGHFADKVSKFVEMFQAIGGKAYRIKTQAEIPAIFSGENVTLNRVVSAVPGIFSDSAVAPGSAPQTFHDVDLFITRASLAVAENGAVWVQQQDLPERVLPFITTHLAIVITAGSVVATMHEAYRKIGLADYDFATFIAGPSRTADIEQSLVLGAHGAVSMRVFIEDGRFTND